MTGINSNRSLLSVRLLLLVLTVSMVPCAEAVRLKNLARIDGVRSNMLTGYGIVVGLAGSGDTPRSVATQQSVVNALRDFGVTIEQDDISTRNTAVVILTAELPPFSEPGNRMDVVVSSLGDARSLVGGTLLLAPLKAPNNEIIALAQGQVSIGGFRFDLNGNLVQKNHPTVGVTSNGAIIEEEVSVELVSKERELSLLLNQSDFTTATRLVGAINGKFNQNLATAEHAGRISIKVPNNYSSIVRFISEIENVDVQPDNPARIVINERTGTIVSGGDVFLQDVTISHGNIKLTISTDYEVSQPSFVTALRSPGIATRVVPDTEIQVEEGIADSVQLPSNATITDLVGALQKIKTSTRDIIVILQAIKASGSLHAELVVQ